jgi:hypothetical protein
LITHFGVLNMTTSEERIKELYQEIQVMARKTRVFICYPFR